MSGSPKQRSERMRDLLETVYSHEDGIPYLALARAACREWLIDIKTAKSYCSGLLDAGVVVHDPPGGPLHITKAGERWLDAGTAHPPVDHPKIIPRRPTPPTPPEPEGGAEDGNTEGQQ